MLFAKATITLKFEVAKPVAGNSKEEVEKTFTEGDKEEALTETRREYEELLAKGGAKLLSMDAEIEVVEV